MQCYIVFGFKAGYKSLPVVTLHQTFIIATNNKSNKIIAVSAIHAADVKDSNFTATNECALTGCVGIVTTTTRSAVTVATGTAVAQSTGDHLPLKTDRVQHINFLLRQVTRSTFGLHEYFVFRTLCTNPASQGGVRCILGRNITGTKLFEKRLQFMILVQPRCITFPFRPRKSNRFQCFYF